MNFQHPDAPKQKFKKQIRRKTRWTFFRVKLVFECDFEISWSLGPWDHGSFGHLDLSTLGPWDSWTIGLWDLLPPPPPPPSSYLLLLWFVMVWCGMVWYGPIRNKFFGLFLIIVAVDS